jgi:hypothetical protein
MFYLFQWQMCCFVYSICIRPANAERTGVTFCLHKGPKRWGILLFSPLGTSKMQGHWDGLVARSHLEGLFTVRVTMRLPCHYERDSLKDTAGGGWGSIILSTCCVSSLSVEPHLETRLTHLEQWGKWILPQGFMESVTHKGHWHQNRAGC